MTFSREPAMPFPPTFGVDHPVFVSQNVLAAISKVTRNRGTLDFELLRLPWAVRDGSE